MLATGVKWRKLPAPNAEPFEGRGLYYGAAMTEAQNMAGEDVYIVGAGNSAGQAAVYFSEHAGRVIMVVRGKTLGEKMSQYLVDRLESLPNVAIRLQSDVTECRGDEHLEAHHHPQSRDERDRAGAHALPVRVHRRRSEHGVAEHARRARRSRLHPDRQRHQAGTTEGLAARRASRILLEASVPGVFAAGDVRHESIKRVASAVGEGSVAVHFVHRYLAAS